ncbi:MAG: glycosyltransferase [Thermoplasmata archaeon]|nr:glycosyltransferase [Thermoplasmata archaeon]
MVTPRPVYVVAPDPDIDMAVRAEVDSLGGERAAKVIPLLSEPAEDHHLAVECHRTPEARQAGRGSFGERLSLWPRAMGWRAIPHLRTGSCIADNALAAGATSVHAHGGPHAFTVGAFARRLSGLQLTATVHAVASLARPDIEALGEAKAVFAISRHTVKALRERDVEADLLYPTAAASPAWRPARALDRDRSGIAVLVPSVPGDTAVLLDAAHRVGGDVRFWVAGGGNEGLREVVATTGLSRRFTFFDRLVAGEAPLLTASCDIMLLPELTAASDLPFNVVIALEAGVPVVGPKARGLREVLPGHMFEEPTGEAVAEALAPLIADGDLRRRAGDRNRRFAAENLGPGNLDKLHRTFLDLTGGWSR